MRRLRCPTCGCDLVQARRALKVRIAQRWQHENRERYNAYQREYQKKYRQRKREAVSQ